MPPVEVVPSPQSIMIIIESPSGSETPYLMIAVSPTLTDGVAGLQNKTTGGLFGVVITFIVPHDLLVEAPFESLAVIATLNVPVDEYTCDAELVPPVEVVPSPQSIVIVTESPSGSETE